MASRPFIAARVEDRFDGLLGRALERRGWQESIIPFTGYGTSEQLRVLARVVLRPSQDLGIVQAANALLWRRGWRNFMNAAKVGAKVTVVIGDTHIPVTADRGGYIDVRIVNPGLGPGWHDVQLVTGDASATARVQVIGDDVTFGIVSDIDDTILSTSLPRPLVAAWNSFVLREQARQAVEGMARLYQQLLADNPGAPIIFVSTGSWNTYPMVHRFMARHGIPQGAMLLTDWGPTNTGWFRSGPDHKRRCLRELARDLPNIRWLLVGDDGQHDLDIYSEFATANPDRVLAIAIRQLTPAEQILAHGTTKPLAGDEPLPRDIPVFKAPDGRGLKRQMREFLGLS